MDEGLDFDMSALDMDMDSEPSAPVKKATANFAMSSASKAGADKHDGGLDFDLSFGDDDSSTTNEAASLEFDMDTTNDFESSSLDMGLDMDSDTDLAVAEEEAPLELSLDEDSSSGAGMSLDFDHSADIVQLDTGSEDIDLDGELDEDIFSNVDEVGTKLDLAKAYVDMGDSDGARSILDEVLEEGDDSQKQQAEELLQQMG